MKFIFHIHTFISYDSFLSPKSILKYVKYNNINTVFITDHNTIKGSLIVEKYAKENNIDVNIILGAEYLTTQGEIIATFIKDEIINIDPVELITEIHNQGGLAILPHPSKFKNLNKEILDKIDAIEIFNPRCNKKENEYALKLANENNKPIIVANDAHIASELKLCENISSQRDSKKALLTVENYSVQYTSFINIRLSQIIKGVKSKNYKLILKQIRYILVYYLIKPLKKLSQNE